MSVSGDQAAIDRVVEVYPGSAVGDYSGSICPKAALVQYYTGRRFIMQPTEKPSLYERLGGVYSIATVVDDFIDRIMVDPRLNANPLVDEAHHRVPPAGFKYLVTEM